MRAILLVKDKEGLSDERLNGRYGLTGKATVTQQSIAGSMAASFHAGQDVTLSNLRSLNAKLKEAVSAMNGTAANVDKISDTIDKTKSAEGETVQLIASNLWTKLWDGTITPAQFYGAKYTEDLTNESYAGEPGWPVANCGNSMDTPPIPRTLYWDPWLTIRAHGASYPDYVSDDDIKYTSSPDAIQRGAKIKEVSKQMREVFNTFKIVQVASSALDLFIDTLLLWSLPTTSQLIDSIMTQIINSVIEILIDEIFDQLSSPNFKIVELGGYPGRGQFYLDTAPAPFDAGNQNYLGVILTSSVIGNILRAFSVALASYQMAIMAVYVQIAVGGILMQFVYTREIGRAIVTAGKAEKQYLSLGFYSSHIPPILALISNLFALKVTRTKKRGGYNNNGTYLGDAVKYDNGLYGRWGEANEFMSFNSTNVIKNIQTIIQMLDIDIDINLGDSIITQGWTLRPSLIQTGYDNTSSQFFWTTNSSSNRTYMDPWGKTTPTLSWNYNLTNYGSTNAGTWVWGELGFLAKDNKSPLQIKAQLYEGNYYKIKGFSNHNITKTIVITSHFSNDDWEYFSVLNLVACDGKVDKLYLHSERNAIYYRKSYVQGSGTLLHAEQSIWNFDFKSGMSDTPFTDDRRGRLNYYICDFADGVKLQFRPVTKYKDNMLAGELINTEYTYDNFAYINQAARNGNTFGGVQSYANIEGK